MSRMATSRQRWRAAIVGFGTLVAAVVALEILIRIGLVSPFVVPLPSDVLLAFERIVVEEGVFRRFLVTAGEAFGAGLILAAVGIPIGVLLDRLELLRRATESWIAAFAAAPIVLIYPLFLVIFGRSAWTIVMIGALAGLPPVILKTLEGLRAVPSVLINVGRSFSLDARQQFLKIKLPAALPSIFVGIRLGLMFALINVVGVEFLINFGGLGPLINVLAERYDLAGTYAAIAFVVLVSVCFFASLERIERWLRPGS